MENSENKKKATPKPTARGEKRTVFVVITLGEWGKGRTFTEAWQNANMHIRPRKQKFTLVIVNDYYENVYVDNFGGTNHTGELIYASKDFETIDKYRK